MSTTRRSGISFVIGLDAEHIPVQDIVSTLNDVKAVLADVERHVRGVRQASVVWEWSEESPRLELVASANGASDEELQRIVRDALQGFVNVERENTNPSPRVAWPESFGDSARRHAGNIVRRRGRFDAITIQTDDSPPLEIRAAVSELVATGGPRRRLVHSAIDGRLNLISRRGRLWATITEQTTGAIVTCTFSDGMIDNIIRLLTKRVVAEGLVSYGPDGRPVSITEISRLEERPAGRSLDSFLGAAPTFTGSLAPEEFIEKVRLGG